MAALHIRLEENRYQVRGPGFYFEFPGGSSENRKALILFLRGFKPEPGAQHGLFSQEQIAKAIPDFPGATRQSICEHERRFAESGQNLRVYLNRRRKVDETVVQAVAEEVEQDPLASLGELTQRVNAKLNRGDLTPANIEAGLEEIPASRVRQAGQKQLAKGAIQYREAYLLGKALAALQAGGRKERQSAAQVLQRADIEAPGEERREGSPAWEAPTIQALCSPNPPVGGISEWVGWVVVCLTLYGYGVPLRVLGRWMGVHKTTVRRWIVGLAQALWTEISRWIVQGINGKVVYLDEKWVKIKGQWHYWFVALDGATELPIVHDLMASRRAWNCVWIVGKLKRLGLKVQSFVTDGLPGYLGAIIQVFPRALHVLCLFHHQQNVTKFVQAQFPEEAERQHRKAQLKQVFQTQDKRTVRHRLRRLQERAAAWGLTAWLQGVGELLPHLLPAVGSRRIPRTTNAIERFFRAFQRFYKVRRGFCTLESAHQQLLLFLVFYVFTQGDKGIAPIERVMPAARTMPLYHLMNDPFRSLGVGARKVKPTGLFAENLLPKAA